MRRLLLFAVLAAFGASGLPAPAGSQTVTAQVVNGAHGFTQGSSGFGFAFAALTLGVAETGAVPPAGPPTITGPTSLLGSIQMCTTSGCDAGFSSNATGTFPMDPTLSGGTVTVTVPSAFYSGGTLTATFTYIGYGPYSESHTLVGGGSTVDPAAPQINHYSISGATLYRNSLLALSSFSSSSIGGISGSGFGGVNEGGAVSLNVNS